MGYKSLKRRRAFTLVEILLALAVVGVLFGLIFAFYRSAIEKSKYVEAVATVDAISKAEELYQMNEGAYTAAASTQEVNERLGLDIKPKWYNYKVVGVTNDNFIVLAERILDEINRGDLSSEPTVIARDKSGPVSPDSIPPEEESEPGAESEPGSGTPPGTDSPSGGGDTDTGDQPNTSNDSSGSAERTPYNNSIDSILDALSTSTIGHDYYDLLIDKSVNIIYDNLLSMGALGLRIPQWWYDVYPDDPFKGIYPANTIVLDDIYRTNYPPQVAATVLIHEATHADWDYNTDTWADYSVDFWNDHGPLPPYVEPGDLPIALADLNWKDNPVTGIPVLGDSVVQEYTAFTNGVLLWKEYKSIDATLTSPFNSEEDAEAAYDNGDLLAYVADLYIGYAPYHTR